MSGATMAHRATGVKCCATGPQAIATFDAPSMTVTSLLA